MKWLRLDKIKKQLRIDPDFCDEDDLLESYGEDAEDTVLNIIGQSVEELYEQYGDIPAPLVQASLLLVGISYQHREAITPQNLYIVPYAFDMRVKPYMRLADG